MMSNENVANAGPRNSSGGMGLNKASPAKALKSPGTEGGERRRSRRLSGAR